LPPSAVLDLFWSAGFSFKSPLAELLRLVPKILRTIFGTGLHHNTEASVMSGWDSDLLDFEKGQVRDGFVWNAEEEKKNFRAWESSNIE